ncbi:MAG: hypothetical protein RR413_10270 [Christensenellaceae bacterium]
MNKFEDLLVDKGLYDAVDISVEDLKEMQKYLSKSECTDNNIDCYCVNCETNRVFEYCNCEVREETGVIRMNVFDDETGRSRKLKPEEAFKTFLNRRYSLTYRCTRDRNHSIIFDLITTDTQVMKVGQYPSVADMTIPEIKKYRTILGKQYRDYSKAVGLFANGIGIGSYVYLRRIIENLLYDKFSQAADEVKMSIQEFSKLHFDEKIDTLRAYLPDLLVSNKSLYGIVSKGIHELSEEECLSMFPCIQTGIELILDDILAEKEKAKKAKAFEKFVSDTTGKLKS